MQCLPYPGDDTRAMDSDFCISNLRFKIERIDALYCIYDSAMGFEVWIHISRVRDPNFSIGIDWKSVPSKDARNCNGRGLILGSSPRLVRFTYFVLSSIPLLDLGYFPYTMLFPFYHMPMPHSYATRMFIPGLSYT